MALEEEDRVESGTIGDRLRTAREAKGLALEDVARQTRIPIRHLEHIERSEWDALPAPTYSVGFARSYANTVGLDGAAIGAELREQIGAVRNYNAADVARYEPADPARVPPQSIAIVAVLILALLVGGYLWWRSGAVDEDPAETAIAAGEAPAEAPAAGAGQQQPQQPAQQAPIPADAPVVLAATEEVWLRIYERGGERLFEGILQPGQRYQVPSAATAPLIRTGRPQALQVTVGGRAIPPLGAPEQTIADVSLRAADLAARAQSGAPQQQPQQQQAVPRPVPSL